MKKLTPVKQYLLGFSLIFLVLLISVVTVLYLSVKPRLDAE
ncbi:MAG: peptidase, partial [Streptococcus gallolyticus]|nr:peptidase [Streptococcus gallolyticus]